MVFQIVMVNPKHLECACSKCGRVTSPSRMVLYISNVLMLLASFLETALPVKNGPNQQVVHYYVDERPLVLRYGMVI